MRPKSSPLNFLIKFIHIWPKHSLCSAWGKTIFTAFSKPLHASVCTANGETGPMHLFNCIMNHVHDASVSDWNMPIATGNIQLCPSKALHAASWPFHFPVKKDESILKYGRHPALKPSMQGFKAMKNLEKKTFPSAVTSVSISTTLPGDLFSTSALKL